MATLPLIDGYRLKSDSKQWVLQKGGVDKDGEDTWSNIGYYSTLKAAVNASYAYFVKKSDADSIDQFVTDGRDILSRLTEALSPSIIITEQ
jgi:hypothetical protein